MIAVTYGIETFLLISIFLSSASFSLDIDEVNDQIEDAQCSLNNLTEKFQWFDMKFSSRAGCTEADKEFLRNFIVSEYREEMVSLKTERSRLEGVRNRLIQANPCTQISGSAHQNELPLMQTTTEPMDCDQNKLKPSTLHLVSKSLETEFFYEVIQRALSDSRFKVGHAWIFNHPYLKTQIKFAKKSVLRDYEVFAQAKPLWNISHGESLPLPRTFGATPPGLESLDSLSTLTEEKKEQYHAYQHKNCRIWDSTTTNFKSLMAEQFLQQLKIANKTKCRLNDPSDILRELMFTDEAYRYAPAILVRGDDLSSIDYLVKNAEFRQAEKQVYGSGVYFATNFMEAHKYAKQYGDKYRRGLQKTLLHQDLPLFQENYFRDTKAATSELFSEGNISGIHDEPEKRSYLSQSYAQFSNWFIVSLILMGKVEHFYNDKYKRMGGCFSGVSARICQINKEQDYVIAQGDNVIPLMLINYDSTY